MLYFLLHYAAPHDTETMSARSSAPGPGGGETSVRPAIEGSLSFSSVSEAVSVPPGGVERQDGPAGNAGGPSLPAELNRNPTGTLPATSGADAKEPDAGSRMAAVAPVEEPTRAAPMPELVAGPKDLRDVSLPARDKADPGATKRGTQLPKLPAEQEDKMLKRGSTLLGQNDIAGARLIFQYLANHGSAGGAFAFAESYDPRKLASHRVAGVTSDADQARSWYARAAELGSREAAAILRKEKP